MKEGKNWLRDDMKNNKEENEQEKYFKDKLGENSDSFKFLEELVKEGIYTWEVIEKKVDIEEEQIVWKGNLDISLTNIDKVVLKSIDGYLFAKGAKNLKNIDIKEYINGSLNIIGITVDCQLDIIDRINRGKLKVGGKIFFGGNIEGIERLCNDKNLVIPGNLDISLTNIDKVVLKSIYGYLFAKGTKNLEEIDVVDGIKLYLNIVGISADFQLKIINKINRGELKVEKKSFFGGNIEGIERLCNNENLVIPGNLNIRRTKTNKIKDRKIDGNINAEGVLSLEEIDVADRIDGDVNIMGTSIEFQLDIIDKINRGKLKVGGKVFFGVDIKGIEKLCNNENLVIPGNLNIMGASIEFQLKIIDKINKGKLTVEGLLQYDEKNVSLVSIVETGTKNELSKLL